MSPPAAPRNDLRALADLSAAATAARLRQNLSQQELADRAGISKRTLERFEAGESTTTVNLVRILRGLDLLDNLGLLFPQEPPSPLEQLRQAGTSRRRASPKRAGRGAGRPDSEPKRAGGGRGTRPARMPWGDERPTT